MSYEIEGKVKVIENEQTFDSGFKKREFVITTHGEYPQDVKLELTQDRCDRIEKVKVGDDVKVKFDVRGNEWKNKYYVNLQAWHIEAAQQDQQPQADAPKDHAPEPPSDADKLPF